MQFIDTHIHLQDFKADFAPRVLADAAAERLVLVAAQQKDFAQIAALLTAYPQKLCGAFGLHPWYYQDGLPIDILIEYLRLFPRALVGEIGVDGLKEAPGRAQAALFAAQLQLAYENDRPVIVHAARAFAALTVHEQALKKVRFVYHGFVKNRELIKFIKKCDGYFGLGGHFLRQEKAAAMLAEMPPDKILFETDAPYQTAEDNYCKVVQERLRQLAAIGGQPAEQLEKQLLQNAEDFLTW